MLQFEPSAALTFTLASSAGYSLTAGPMVGLSLHYGPDEDSDSSGDDRTSSFFALGPMVGGFAGVTLKRPGKAFDIQLGITLHATPLIAPDDSDKGGYVLGGSLDITLLWR